jgi:hypothetical protein
MSRKKKEPKCDAACARAQLVSGACRHGWAVNEEEMQAAADAVVALRTGKAADGAPLDRIAALLDRREWDVGDLDEIAIIVRDTGRAVRDPNDVEPDAPRRVPVAR